MNEPTRYRSGAYGAMIPDPTGPFVRYDDYAILATTQQPTDLESLLRRVDELAEQADHQGQALLHNALMGILLASRFPYPLKQATLNIILALPAFGLWAQRIDQ